MLNTKLLGIKRKLKKIELIALDFDGVLTDGGIYLGNEVLSFRRFDSKDGLGIKLLQSISIKIAIISGSSSNIINKRSENLGISIIKKGESNKAEAILKIQDSLNLSREKVLFLGDDVNDLNVIPYVNLFFTPKNAHQACKKQANFVGKFNGGEGFVREVADKILLSHGLNPYKEFKTRNEFSD